MRLRPRSSLSALACLAATAVLMAATGAASADAEKAPRAVLIEKDLAVSVKGTFGDGDTFLARSVTLMEKPETSVRGRLDAIDIQGRRVHIGPLEYALDEKSDVVDEDGKPLELAQLTPGQTAKISLERRDDGSLAVDKVRRRADDSEYIRVDGPVEEILPALGGGFRFSVLGVAVAVGPDTQWEGIARPTIVGALDDESARRAEPIRLGKFGWLSGEVRLDASDEANFDGADEDADDLRRGRLKGEVEWTPPRGKYVSGVVQLKLTHDEILHDDTGLRASSDDVRLGQANIVVSGIAGRAGSIQAGRSRWEDEREWWFREDLDSLRFFFQKPRWSVEAAMAEQHGAMPSILKEARTWMLRATLLPSEDHSVTLRVVRREDGDSGREFEPRHVGLHAEGGVGKIWSYWIDLAFVRGEDDGDDLHGNAIDVGLQATLRTRFEPTFVLSYAEASETFRQTGLQNNNAKWNGVTDFHYYGEIFDPELANLVVKTVGFGLRPARETSIDVAWHGYAFDEWARHPVDSGAIDDRTLLPGEMDLGQEWDVVVGYEALERWEFELDLGRFEPGDAVLGPRDPATLVALKVKWLF